MVRLSDRMVNEHASTRTMAHDLIGRDSERGDILRALLDSETRLVSLIGVGGVGKTHLALAVMQEFGERFPGGCAFVPLAAVTDAPTMIRDIAASMGVESVNESPLAAMARDVGDARILLVLDNLEHLDAGPQVEALLEALPGARILTTSRAPLRISAERVLVVNPLQIPDAALPVAELANNPAVALFAARSQSLTGPHIPRDAELMAIADICRRVDGIPLAIELAAGLSRVLTPGEIKEHLDRRLDRLKDNRFSTEPRHATMRATIAWSYERLPAEEQALFRRLSVFADGFTLDMVKRMVVGRRAGEPYPYADGFGVPFGHGRYLGRDLPMEAVDGPSLRRLGLAPLAMDPIDGLAALVDHSLVQRRVTPSGDSRYSMYETIREFGLERLAQEGEEHDVRHLHAAIMLAIFEAGIEGLYYADRTVFERNRLAVAIPNFREAMRWLDRQGAAGAEIGQRLAGCSWIFWQQSGRISEGRHWMELALRHKNPGWAYAAYLPALGFLCWIQGDDDAAEQILHEALLRTGEAGLISSEASTYLYLACVAWRKGPLAQNDMLLNLQRSFDLYQSIDEPLGIGVCTQLFGVIAQIGGDPGKALELQREALDQYTRCGYGWGQAAANLYIGGLLIQTRAPSPDLIREGIQRVRASFSQFAEMGDAWGAGGAAGVLGASALQAGIVESAGILLGAAVQLLKSGRSFLPPVNDAVLAEAIEGLRASVGQDACDALLRTGAARTAPDLAALVVAVTDGILAQQNGDAPAEGVERHVRLTRNQAEIVRLLGEGLKPTQIAKQLDRHESSVYETIGRIQERLGVGKWEQIVPAAQSLGLLNQKQ